MPELNDQELENELRAELKRHVQSQATRLVGLEERVMAELRSRQRPSPKLWAPAPRRAFGLSRRFALATIAIALVIFAGGLFAGMQVERLQSGLANKGTGVQFVIAYPEAQSVAVAGDFTNWNKVPLERGPDGVWRLWVQLPPGRYEYAFIVNGSRWLPDPRASQFVRSYGNDLNSVIYVGKGGETS
jgi:hypothetical protein